MTSLGLQGWLIQILGVIVALAVATGRGPAAAAVSGGPTVRS